MTRKVYSVLIFFFLFSFTCFAQSDKLKEAASLYSSGKYEQAGKLFEEVINAGNTQREIFDGAIDCALKLKKFSHAIALTEKALTKFKSDYGLQVLLAQLYAQDGKAGKSISILERIIKQYPDSSGLRDFISEVFSMQGSTQYKANNFSGATESFRSAVKYNNRNREARINLIVLLLKNQDYKSALPYAKDGYSLFPGDKDISVVYLEILIATENFKDAVTVSERIAKSNPDDIKAGLNNALAYRYNSEPMKAYYKYAELRAKFPRSKEVYLAEIAFLELNAKTDTIIARYREYLALTPDDKEMITGLGKTYEYRKSYDTARTIYRELINRDLDRDAVLLIAECYAKENRKDSAAAVIKNYIVTGGKNPAAFVRISELLLTDGKDAEARIYLSRATKLFPSAPEFNITLAKSFVYGGMPDSALAVIEPVKQRYSEYPALSYLTGLIYAGYKDTAKAIFQFSRAIKFGIEQSGKLQAQIMASVSGNNMNNPDSIASARTKGNELDSVTSILKDSFKKLQALQNSEQYLTTLKKFITDIPYAGILYLQRAIHYRQLGRNDEAQNDFETALNLSPSSDEVQSEAGIYYEETGNIQKALDAYRKAASLNKKQAIYLRKCIDLAQQLNVLNDICNHWLMLHETDKRNTLLREYLIEALHKAGRIPEAQNIINEE